MVDLKKSDGRNRLKSRKKNQEEIERNSFLGFFERFSNEIIKNVKYLGVTQKA